MPTPSPTPAIANGSTCRLTSLRFKDGKIVWVVRPIAGTTCYLVELCDGHQMSRPRRAYATTNELRVLRPALSDKLS